MKLERMQPINLKALDKKEGILLKNILKRKALVSKYGCIIKRKRGNKVEIWVHTLPKGKGKISKLWMQRRKKLVQRVIN